MASSRKLPANRRLSIRIGSVGLLAAALTLGAAACGSDRGSALVDIVWHNWGSSEAIGTGTYAAIACTPNCASGPTRYEEGKVFLIDLVPYDGGMAYENITLVAPADVQPAMGNHITGAMP